MSVIYDLPGRGALLDESARTYDIPGGGAVQEVSSSGIDAVLAVTESTDTIVLFGGYASGERVYDLPRRGAFFEVGNDRLYDLPGGSVHETVSSGTEGFIALVESADTISAAAITGEAQSRVYDLPWRGALFDAALRGYDLPGFGSVTEYAASALSSLLGELLLVESSDTAGWASWLVPPVDSEVDVFIAAAAAVTESTDTDVLVGSYSPTSTIVVVESTDTLGVVGDSAIDAVADVVEASDQLLIQESFALVAALSLIESSDTVAMAGAFDGTAVLAATESSDTVAFVGANAVLATMDVDEVQDPQSQVVGTDVFLLDAGFNDLLLVEDSDTIAIEATLVLSERFAVIALVESSDTVSIQQNPWLVVPGSGGTWATVVPATTQWSEAA